MEKSQIKKLVLSFIIPVVICTVLGYLSQTLMHSILTGIVMGTGAVIAASIESSLKSRTLLNNCILFYATFHC